MRPLGSAGRDDRWARAERVAFGESALPDSRGADPARQVAPDALALAAELQAELGHAPTGGPALPGRAPGDPSRASDPGLGPDQLVHGDLAGNVLLDATGLPVVLDLAPYWRPVRWAEAVCVLDAVLWHGADATVLDGWSRGEPRRAMLRAGLFRVLGDRPCDVAAYRRVLLPDAPTEAPPAVPV